MGHTSQSSSSEDEFAVVESTVNLSILKNRGSLEEALFYIRYYTSISCYLKQKYTAYFNQSHGRHVSPGLSD